MCVCVCGGVWAICMFACVHNYYTCCVILCIFHFLNEIHVCLGKCVTVMISAIDVTSLKYLKRNIHATSRE